MILYTRNAQLLGFYETDGGTGPQMLPEVRRDSDGHFYPHVKRELTGHQRMRLAFGLIKNVDKLGDGWFNRIS